MKTRIRQSSRPVAALLAVTAGLAVTLLGVSAAGAAQLAFSTYWGGSGDESAVALSGSTRVAVDAEGNFYVAGTTSSTDFPATPAVVQGPHGGLDIFVTKL